MLNALIPRPASTEWRDGQFFLMKSTTVAAPDALHVVGRALCESLRSPTGFDVPLVNQSTEPGVIQLEIDPTLTPEAYRLSVLAERVVISGGDQAGVFWGCQTFLQLLPPSVYRSAFVADTTWTAPAAIVRDAPRFTWRGLMLDVARHFVPKREVLRLIDLMAMHKLNVLQLHLTDDQGWRIEIQRYPKLTEVGGWRRESMRGLDPDVMDGRPHGGFYTQEDLREIVAYAGQRSIIVVPEIDVPGHTQAAISAYPQLGVTGQQWEPLTRWATADDVLNMEESTVQFILNVLDEVMEIFPSRYIGIGGDECPKGGWRSDARTQERMSELRVVDEGELQSWFIKRLGEHLVRSGRFLLGWDDILEGGLAPGATVASWRGNLGGITAARLGHDVISCPSHQTYFDYRQSDLPDEPIPAGVRVTLDDVYLFDPVPSELDSVEARHVLGGQANIWTELMDSSRTIDYMVFPRACGLADALWRNSEPSVEEFHLALTMHLKRLDAIGVEYRQQSGPRPWQSRPDAAGDPQTLDQYQTAIAKITANIGIK